MTDRTDVAVVVLNWKNAPDTLECLESLAVSGTPVDVIVVDNDSADGSVEAIERSGLAALVIAHHINAGYAGGNNVGLRAALDKGYGVIAVLNNDTVVEPDALGRLVEVCSRSPSAVAVSPRITYFDRPGEVWFAGGVVDRGLPRHLQPDELTTGHGVAESGTLTGCCVMASAGTWREVGLFDEGYFLIFEDSDWSARAQRAQVRLLVDHDSVVRHKVSRSFVGGSMALISTYFYTRNGLRYHARYQRRHLHTFIGRRVLRPLLRTRKDGLGRSLFVLWATMDWIRGRQGNASPRAWRVARRESLGREPG